MAIPGFHIESSKHSAFTNLGEYSLEQEASERDSHIVDLNSELTKYEGHLSTAVGEREHSCVSLTILLDLQPCVSFPSSRFAFEGIDQLLEHLLVSEAERIRLANASGMKMIGNILGLQQIIETLPSDTRGAGFDRTKKYYTLFFRTPTRVP